MTLLELLVKELPKRGGWPESYTPQLDSFIKKEKLVLIVNSQYSCFEDWDGNRVERDQYQSALAASQKVEWSGDGLPPVGCVCESQYKVHGSDWVHFECIAVDGKALFGWSNNTPVALQSNTHNFRPLCTEAERKRDEAIDEMREIGLSLPAGIKFSREEMAVLYDAGYRIMK